MVSNPNGLPRPFRHGLQDILSTMQIRSFNPERASQAIPTLAVLCGLVAKGWSFKPERASQAIPTAQTSHFSR